MAHRIGFLDPVVEGLTYAGTYGVVWLAIAATVALLWRRPEIFVWTLAAAVVAVLASSALQAAIPRTRPHADVLVGLPHSHSFPSGHATSSFACATVIAAFVPRASVPIFLLASLVAWSRVYVGVHYPVDVLAGALLGVALGLSLLRVLRWLAAVRPRSPRAPRPG